MVNQTKQGLAQVRSNWVNVESSPN